MSTEQLLYIIICISFFLLAFIALANPNKVNVIANRWLGLFFVFVGFKVLSSLIFSFKINHQYNFLASFVDVTAGIMPVLLYLSIIQFATPGNFNKRHYLSFIPSIVIFLVVLPFHIINGFTGYPLSPAWNRVLALAMLLTVNLQIWVLWALAYRKLKQHQENIQLLTANTTPVNLSWLKHMLQVIGFMMLVYVGNNLLKQRSHALYEPLIYLTCSLVICYHLIAQKEIFPYQPSEIEEVSLVIEEFQHQPKQVKSRLDDDLSQQLKLRLEHLMRHDKLYLDSELNLPQLAQSMEISVHDLSYLLNESIGMNFFRFINAHRIEEAKKLMLSDKHKHLNILGIAYSAGFSSKTTFNTVFKKQTGLSPSEFMKQAKAETHPAVSYQS